MSNHIVRIAFPACFTCALSGSNSDRERRKDKGSSAFAGLCSLLGFARLLPGKQHRQIHMT